MLFAYSGMVTATEKDTSLNTASIYTPSISVPLCYTITNFSWWFKPIQFNHLSQKEKGL